LEEWQALCCPVWVKSDFQLSDKNDRILSDHSQDIASCLDRMSANSNQLTAHYL
jgi:hypothetical protein